MKIKLLIFFSLTLFFTSSCVNKNLQKNYNRQIVGKWALTTLTKGDTEVKARGETFFQFTANRQIIINNQGKKHQSTYFIRENILTVDDGVITDIREELTIQKLDISQLILSFSVDSKPAKMTFQKVVAE